MFSGFTWTSLESVVNREGRDGTEDTLLVEVGVNLVVLYDNVTVAYRILVHVNTYARTEVKRELEWEPEGV